MPITPVSMTSARGRFEELLRTHAPYLGPQDFQFTEDWEYEETLQSIQDHKYLVNERIPYEITLEEALFSWYENVYHPVSQAIEDEGLEACFPGATRGELFLWVSRHWHFLERESGHAVSAWEAARSYAQRFGTGFFGRLITRIRSLAA